MRFSHLVTQEIEKAIDGFGKAINSIAGSEAAGVPLKNTEMPVVRVIALRMLADAVDAAIKASLDACEEIGALPNMKKLEVDKNTRLYNGNITRVEVTLGTPRSRFDQAAAFRALSLAGVDEKVIAAAKKAGDKKTAAPKSVSYVFID